MEKIWININTVADTFTQIVKNFSSRLDLFIREMLIDFGPTTAAQFVADNLELIQIGSVSKAARSVIEPNTPIVFVPRDSITSVGFIGRTLHVKFKDPVKISLYDDGNLYIGVLCANVGPVSGWISYTKNDKNNPVKVLKLKK